MRRIWQHNAILLWTCSGPCSSFSFPGAFTDTNTHTNSHTFTFTNACPEGFNAQGESIYTHTANKDEIVLEGQEQTVLLEDIPIEVKSIDIDYLAYDGSLVAQSFVEGLELVAGGEPLVIVVSAQAPITECQLNVDFDLEYIDPER